MKRSANLIDGQEIMLSLTADKLTQLFLAISLEKTAIQKHVRFLISNNSLANCLTEISALISKQTQETVSKILKEAEQGNLTLLTIADSRYPELLKHIPDYPWVLFTKGNNHFLQTTSTLGIVGTRQSSNYGNRLAIELAASASKAGLTIISGLAYGIDSEAHKGALSVGGKTIAVLGCGLLQKYPTANATLFEQMETEGLIISEYPPNYSGNKFTFPQRNRIIAGLSRGILVIESKARGGSLITADLGLQYNRDIYAIPGRLDDENSVGTNHLIQKGAKLVMTLEDILQDYNTLHSLPQKTAERNTKHILTSTEEAILAALESSPICLDDLAEKTGLSAATLSSNLMALDMQNLVRALPGKFYSRV